MRDRTRLRLAWAVLVGITLSPGCQNVAPPLSPPPALPRELEKVSIPDYVIEPPDILRIGVVRIVPLPPYRVQALDALAIRATGTFPNMPIEGVYTVSIEGHVDLGSAYNPDEGPITVQGMTVPEVQKAITKVLADRLVKTNVTVALAQSGSVQQIQGEHLVAPDGIVTFGAYGSVRVSGLTRTQAKAAIEEHLSRFLQKPEISLDVVGYNSKVYYLITDGGGAGEQVFRLPVTGNETVLDAVSQINGLPAVASKKHIWVARPAPVEAGAYQIFPVDWKAIAECGATGTNYQLLPGDRLYVKAHPLVRVDNALARALSPIERVLGVGLIGSSIYRNIAQGDLGRGSVVVNP